MGVKIRIKRRRLGQYRCWLCGGHIDITVAPYLRHHPDVCHCESPGGRIQPPSDWTEEQIDEARRNYAGQKVKDSPVNNS